MENLKPPASYGEQVRKLRDHGCAIGDEAFCRETLSCATYYRLSSYLLPFKLADGSYGPGASFERAFRLSEFDRGLRGIFLGAMDALETRLRAAITQRHVMMYGAAGYLAPASFRKSHDAERFATKVRDVLRRNGDVPFVRHHLGKYGGKLPLWVIVDLFEFGTLSHFYQDMHAQDKKAVARALGVGSYMNAENWLRCCTDLRNACAHCGRLYFRPFQSFPSGLSAEDVPESSKNRLWGAVMALKSIFPSPGQWNGEVLPKVEALFWAYARDIDLAHVAFPADWAVKLRK